MRKAVTMECSVEAECARLEIKHERKYLRSGFVCLGLVVRAS